MSGMDVLGLIERVMAAREVREKKSWYPSEIDDCRRKLFYRWTGANGTIPDASGLWVMKIGEAVHVAIQSLLATAAGADNPEAVTGLRDFAVFEEVYKSGVQIPGLGIPMSGRLDLVLRAGGKYLGVEVKTTYGRGTRAIKEAGPRVSALWQSIAYLEMDRIARAAGAPMFSEPLAGMVLVYISRDDSDRTQFEIIPSPAGWAVAKRYRDSVSPMFMVPRGEWVQQVRRLADVEAALETMDPPPRDYLAAIKNGEVRDQFVKAGRTYRTDWQCRYCSFAGECWKPAAALLPEGDNSREFTARAAGEED